LQIRLVELPVSVTAEEVLGLAGRDAESPGCRHGVDDADGIQILIEHLNAAIAAIRDVDVVFGIRRDAVDGAELLRTGPRCRPSPSAVFVRLRDARVVYPSLTKMLPWSHVTSSAD
jgi:hypothetical protein